MEIDLIASGGPVPVGQLGHTALREVGQRLWNAEDDLAISRQGTRWAPPRAVQCDKGLFDVGPTSKPSDHLLRILRPTPWPRAPQCCCSLRPDGLVDKGNQVLVRQSRQVGRPGRRRCQKRTELLTVRDQCKARGLYGTKQCCRRAEDHLRRRDGFLHETTHDRAGRSIGLRDTQDQTPGQISQRTQILRRPDRPLTLDQTIVPNQQAIHQTCCGLVGCNRDGIPCCLFGLAHARSALGAGAHMTSLAWFQRPETARLVTGDYLRRRGGNARALAVRRPVAPGPGRAWHDPSEVGCL